MKKTIFAVAGFIVAGLFVVPVFAHADVVLDATSTSGSEGSSTAFSWPHTIGSGGSNGLLLVSLSVNASLPEPIQSVFYGTRPLTEVVSSSDPNFTSEFWYLKNPPAGTNNISVVLATSAGSVNTDAVGGAYSFFGVDQTSPFEAPPSVSLNFGASSISASATTNDNNEYIIDSLSAEYGGTSTPNGGQISLYNDDTPALSEMFGSSYELVPAPTTTGMGWNF